MPMPDQDCVVFEIHIILLANHRSVLLAIATGLPGGGYATHKEIFDVLSVLTVSKRRL